MIPSEYLAFIPLLIYGIALADLLSQWKRLFNPKDLFIPYLLMTIILTETALYNVFVYAEVINKLGGQTYLVDHEKIITMLIIRHIKLILIMK